MIFDKEKIHDYFKFDQNKKKTRRLDDKDP